MRLQEYRIDRYGPLAGVHDEPEAGIQVLYGPNESGKTLLLEAICRLLDPDSVDRFEGIERVEHAPQGFVRVGADDGGPEAVLDGEGALGDLVDLGPNHLRNVFVVRDSDLRIRGHHEFYDGVIERLGDIHTAEIEAVRDALEARGRLTSTRRNLADSDPTDHAAAVRDAAADLRDDLRAYVESAREDDVDALEAELVRVDAERERLEASIATLEHAAARAEYDDRREDLERYESLLEERAELGDVSREALEAVAELAAERDRLEATIEGLEGELSERTDRVTELVERTADLEAELGPYEERRPAVDRAEDALESLRESRAAAADAGNGRLVAAATGVGGIAAGGLALAAGAGFGAWVIVAIGIAGLALAAWQHRLVAGRERARTAVLEAARDAGFEVESVDEVGPALGRFRNDRESLESRLEARENELTVARERRNDTRSALEEARDELAGVRDELESTLREADVPDVETYRERVDRKEAVEADLGRLGERLATSLGTPSDREVDLTDPADPDTLLAHWRDELAALIADVPDDADPADRDPDRLADRRERLHELETRRDSLETALASHRARVEDFRDRLDRIETAPFLEDPVQLGARSVDGLERLAEDLDRLVATIERDAAVSRVALDVFDGIHAAEERKLAGLFEPEGRASEAFATMTGGRYESVTYDPERRRLVVERADGEPFASTDLSHATRDALFLAARLSLGEQLLGGDPGFFLMDDPFLPADRERLIAGFETLEGLAESGWQVLYLTAKPEVGETMADRFDLPVAELDPLD